MNMCQNFAPEIRAVRWTTALIVINNSDSFPNFTKIKNCYLRLWFLCIAQFSSWVALFISCETCHSHLLFIWIEAVYAAPDMASNVMPRI